MPKPGSVFLTIDYSYIELVTLAAVCKARYGFSVLGQVIIDGIDPHSFTAAMFKGVPLEEFMKMKESANELERNEYIELRQKAKVVQLFFFHKVGYFRQLTLDFQAGGALNH